MKSIRIISIALLSGWALTALAAPPAQSAQANKPGSIKLQLVELQEKVTVGKDGSRHVDVVPLQHTLPGTEVIYNLNYEIIGTVETPVFTDPVPQNMEYVAGSAAGVNADITFSVDGGKTYGTPDSLQVKNPDGSMRPALPKEYTNVRWVLKGNIAVGTKGTLSYHAILQ